MAEKNIITACSDGISTANARKLAENKARHKAAQEACGDPKAPQDASGGQKVLDEYSAVVDANPVRYFQPEGKKGTNYWCVEMKINAVKCKKSSGDRSDKPSDVTGKDPAKKVQEDTADEMSLLSSDQQDEVRQFIIDKVVKEGLTYQEIVKLVRDKIKELSL